jgi:hypothetical protein
VDTGHLLEVKLAAIYKEVTLTLHTPPCRAGQT